MKNKKKKTSNHTITKERNNNATVQISTKKNQQTCEKKTDQKTNAIGQTNETTRNNKYISSLRSTMFLQNPMFASFSYSLFFAWKIDHVPFKYIP